MVPESSLRIARAEVTLEPAFETPLRPCNLPAPACFDPLSEAPQAGKFACRLDDAESGAHRRGRPLSASTGEALALPRLLQLFALLSENGFAAEFDFVAFERQDLD